MPRLHTPCDYSLPLHEHPARYVTGYLGDIGIPPVPDPMDFSAWMEVYLGGRWFPFDPRNNRRRIGPFLNSKGSTTGTSGANDVDERRTALR